MLKQKEYHIEFHSKVWFIFIATGLSGIVLSLSHFLLLLINNDKLINYAGFLLIVGSIRIAAWLSKVRSKIIITNYSISHAWEKNNLFKAGNDFDIPWEKIKGCGYHCNKIFESLEINLINRRKYQLYRLNFLNYTDNFEQFITDLPVIAQEHGINLYDQLYTDNKSTMLSRILNWFMIIVGVLFSLLLYSKLFDSESKVKWLNIILLGIFMFAYYTYHKINNANNS